MPAAMAIFAPEQALCQQVDQQHIDHAQQHLGEAHPEEVPPEYQVKEAEKVGVERRLEEGLGGGGFAQHDLLRHLIVGIRIHDGIVEEGILRQFIDVEDADEQRQPEDYQQWQIAAPDATFGSVTESSCQLRWFLFSHALHPQLFYNRSMQNETVNIGYEAFK